MQPTHSVEILYAGHDTNGHLSPFCLGLWTWVQGCPEAAHQQSQPQSFQSSEKGGMEGKRTANAKTTHIQVKNDKIILVMGVAFTSLARIWGKCSTIHSSPQLFFFLFLKWRLACAHQFHSLHQDQSTVAQGAETGQWYSQPTLTSLGQGCMCI